MKKGSLAASFYHAYKGVAETVKSERNMKIHVAAACAVACMGVAFQISKQEWAVCVMLVALVFAGELLNTAVEAVVDLVTQERHPLAQKAKDAAAGGVLVLAIGAALIGCMIFVPKILAAFA